MTGPSKICRVGILISGRGSNMIALADAVEQGSISGAEIALVITDQPGAEGLARAAERGLKTLVIERGDLSREQHEQELVEALVESQIDLVCLAGYMRLLSRYFIDAYRGRILNIHPSLLPAFPGLAAQRQALDHGAKWSGCTVHFVDETLDGGPIIAQSIVPVWEEDSEETLSARILEQEHVLYPQAVAQIVRGQYE
ncbi:MAG: phosphoribosylglycinamide formyltransferase, partial [Pyrinomonadaceae bacterium]